MYSISNIILRKGMSVVNLKIIFVKKQKRHPNAQLKAGGGGGDIHLQAETTTFTLRTDYSWAMGYPFDNPRQIGNTS